jgi:uncharacterized protein YukE
MADNLSGIHEDVKFDWTTAANLARELRSTADELDRQIGERNGSGAAARKQWRGVYGEQFDGRLKICTGDAKHFADTMRKAATGLDELAKAAQQEQDRRVKARAWVEKHNHEGWVHKHIWDPLTGGDEPPVPPPVDPPKIPIGDPQSRSRGPEVPASAM